MFNELLAAEDEAPRASNGSMKVAIFFKDFRVKSLITSAGLYHLNCLSFFSLEPKNGSTAIFSAPYRAGSV